MQIAFETAFAISSDWKWRAIGPTSAPNDSARTGTHYFFIYLYVLKPDVHAPVCDLGTVVSSHTVSIGLRLTVVSNFHGASDRVDPGRLVGGGLPAAPMVRRQ